MATAGHQHDSNCRGYVPDYTVRYRGSQRAEHRFGPGHRAEIQQMLQLEDDAQDPPDFNGQWEDFPRVARARMNLTALSQHYDLYFVAYRGHIYVYRLNRGCRVALGEPAAILNPKDSGTRMAKHVGGYINPTFPQEINHMVVGELGEEEILLVGRDNGDVAAWYTHMIARHIETDLSRSKERLQRDSDSPGYDSRLPSPKHFFADNVGMSAWGLAIHKESRLIAVSSNTHEITVFAFAMNRKEGAADPPSSGSDRVVLDEQRPTCGDQAPESPPGHTLVRSIKDSMWILVLEEAPSIEHPIFPWELNPSFHDSVAAYLPDFANGRGKLQLSRDKTVISEGEAHVQIGKLQRRFQTRQRSWRIVLSLGADASNVPSIAFCEDAEGNANRIAAIDINGYLYVVDIWQIARKPIRVPPHNVQTPAGRRQMQVRGWNILPVTDSHLLQTRTLHAAIGLHPSKAVHRAKTSRGAWLDISKCMSEVPHDAASPVHKRRIANFRPSDVSGERDGLTAGSSLEIEIPVVPLLASHVLDPIHDPDDGIDLGAGPVHLAMTMVPYSGAHHTAFPTPQALAEFAGPRAAIDRAQRVRAALTPNQFRKKAQLWDAEDLLRDVSFLRFNEHDIEISSLNPSDCGAVCHHVLDNWNAHNQQGNWDMHFGQRCSMLLRIPELNLVIMGSMCGRVALITLTKPPQPEDTPSHDTSSQETANVPRRAFRVDAVLPFNKEERSKERPFVCLLGIAVSPVPEARSRGLELRRRRQTKHGGREIEPGPPRRWRLILNYQDHTVMQYEIVRREDGEKRSWSDFTGPAAHRHGCFRVSNMGDDSETKLSDSNSEGRGGGDGGADLGNGNDDGGDGVGSDTESEHGQQQEELIFGAEEAEWHSPDPDADFPDMQFV
ncbi:hypothetical protein SLS53_003227 [Cytospora paraplurivora]|uniref:Uncharacterized protein n=1 Tax=Cytospora paraplurivora TaxID=2898453 RepID=A0AAN9YHG8_9PEZI